MKVKYVATMTSKPTKHRDLTELIKKTAEGWRKEFSGEFQVLSRVFGLGSTLFVMADFDDLSSLEKFLENRGKAIRDVVPKGALADFVQGPNWLVEEVLKYE